MANETTESTYNYQLTSSSNIVDLSGEATVTNITSGSLFIDGDTLSLGSNTWGWGANIKADRLVLRGTKEKPIVDGNIEARFILKQIKTKLNKLQQNKFQEYAEKAFKESVENYKLGLVTVAQEFEKIMEKNLKLAVIQASGFDKFISYKQIDKYRKDLPKCKELVIDSLKEYEKPIPRDAQKVLSLAKKSKLFDDYKIFWIREVKDPIIFGITKEMPDLYFFISEWGEDISFNDFK